MPSGVDGASLFCNVWLVLSDCDSGLNNFIFLSIVVVVRNMGYTGTKNLFLEIKKKSNYQKMMDCFFRSKIWN